MQCIWLSLLLLIGSAERTRGQTCIASGAISDCNPLCAPPYIQVPEAGICGMMNLKCCKLSCGGQDTLCLPKGEECNKYGYTPQTAKLECKERGVCCAEPKKPPNWPDGYSWPPYNDSDWPTSFVFEDSYKLPDVWPRGWKMIPESAYPEDYENTTKPLDNSELMKGISFAETQGFQERNNDANASPSQTATNLPTVKVTTQTQGNHNSQPTPQAQFSKPKPTQPPEKTKDNQLKDAQEEGKSPAKLVPAGLPTTQSPNPSAAGIPPTQPQNPPESGVVPSQPRPTQPSPDSEPNMSSSTVSNNGSNSNNFRIPQEASLQGGNSSKTPYAEAPVAPQKAPPKPLAPPPPALRPADATTANVAVAPPIPSDINGTAITPPQLSNNASTSFNQSEQGSNVAPGNGVSAINNKPAVSIAQPNTPKPKIPQMSESKKPQHTEIELNEDDQELKRPSSGLYKQVEKTTNTKHHKHKLTYSKSKQEQGKQHKAKKKKKRVFMIQRRHYIEKLK